MTQLNINGMHCESCVSTITQALNNVEGIDEANVSLADKTAKISGDFSLEVAIRAIENVGYKAFQLKNIDLTVNQSSSDLSSDWAKLFPLFLIFLYISVSALGLNWENLQLNDFMLDFMGLFYIVFSFFKFLDYKNFPDSFIIYDPIAKLAPAYGWLYPFLELGLGLCFLMRLGLEQSLVITILILGATTFGVVNTLLNKVKIECACLGTVLKLPMTKATLIENSLMIIMAIWLLIP